MLNPNKRKITSLAEDFKEVGLDPEKAMGQIERTSSLVEQRLGGSNGGGSPDYTRPTAPGAAPAPAPAPATEAPAGPASSEDELEEGALKAVKVKIRTAGAKLKAKLKRKKAGLGKLRAKARAYRRTHKRKIKIMAKKKLAKFGRAGLEKLHKLKKRVTMSEPDSPLAGLREDLNSLGEAPVEESAPNAYEEAAYNAGMLALYLGQIFEAYGDGESAETMYDTSDAAADLAEALEVLDEDAELDEDQEASLGRVMEPVVKALRYYEEMGAPSLDQVLDFVAESAGDAEGDGDADGEGGTEEA